MNASDYLDIAVIYLKKSLNVIGYNITSVSGRMII